MAMTRRYKALLMIGLVMRLLGAMLMIRYRTADDPTYMLVLCQLLQGIGGGSIAITMQVAVQVTVRHADVAIVTALELLTTEIGAAIGSATAGWMFQTYLPPKLQANLPNMDADELNLVYGSLQKALSYPLGSYEREAIIEAWVEVMRMLCIVATVTLVPAVLFGLAIPTRCCQMCTARRFATITTTDHVEGNVAVCDVDRHSCRQADPRRLSRFALATRTSRWVWGWVSQPKTTPTPASLRRRARQARNAAALYRGTEPTNEKAETSRV